jgi:hypothetical protein
MQDELESLAILGFWMGMFTTHEVVDEGSTLMLFYANAIERYAWEMVIKAVDEEVPWKQVMMTERMGRN